MNNYKSYLAKINWDKIYARRRLIAGILTALLILYIILHYVGANKNPKTNALPVDVAKVKKEDFSITLFALGSVNSNTSVNVISQVTGQIKKQYFQDGQSVKAGELLIEIDPSAYEAQLKESEGQLARDKALLENAMLDLNRYQQLWKQNAVSKQILDTQQALVNQYAATVKLDEGNVENAKVNLGYCKITSPLDGKIGIGLIDEGNIVQAAISTTPVAVLNTITPISVNFNISEKYLPILLKNTKDSIDLKVEAYNHDKSELLGVGKLVAIDNQIDPLTGTIKLKATFSNEDFKLYPNQFVNIKLYVETLKDVFVVPTSAIQHGIKGVFLYLVNEENKINIHNIVVKMNAEGKSVVEDGIKENDRVVIEGTDKLTEGALVSLPEEKNDTKGGVLPPDNNERQKK